MSRYRIFQADAFAWLRRRKALSIQAVVSDPPFGIEYSKQELLKKRNGNGGIWRLPQGYDGWTRKPMPRFTVLKTSEIEQIREFHASLAPLLMRVLVPGGHVILSSQNLLSYLVIGRFLECGFELRGQIARLVRTLRGGDRPKGAHKDYPGVSVSPRSCWEPWLVFRKPCEGTVSENLARWRAGALRRPDTNLPFPDVIRSSPVRGEERLAGGHPSQKPQEFMRQLVHAALPLGEGVILDPFMGCGATIAAAEHWNLRSIGIENDEEFFLLAERSIPRLMQLQI